MQITQLGLKILIFFKPISRSCQMFGTVCASFGRSFNELEESAIHRVKISP